MTKRFKYLYSDTDRHGNQRLYFKPSGCKKVRIDHPKGSKAARVEYKRLMADYEAGDMPVVSTVNPHSIEWMLNKYQNSATFLDLAGNTQIQRSNFYARFVKVHGREYFEDLTASDIAATRDALPRFAARNFVKAMRAAFKWASSQEVGIASSNPAAAVSLPSGATKGHKPWTLNDVIHLRDHYPYGHNARICLAMILCTGQRISDVRTLGRASVRNGTIKLTQIKSGNEVELPVLPILRDELGDKYNERVWLATSTGKPYSKKSVSMRFSHWCSDAGLPDLAAHGLRKSVGTIIAELGMSENIIMSVLGHNTSSEAQVYVKTANRASLANTGMQAFSAELSRVWGAK